MASLTIRRQPPAHSPLRARDLWTAGLAPLRVSRPDLVAELERLLRERFDASQVLLCGSGTQALDLAIRVAVESSTRPGDGRSVALPGYGCFDLVSAAVGADVAIVPYDLDPDTLGPDPESFRKALERGARAAVVAPLYGFPVDWDLVRAEAEATGCSVIEDAAQGAGARWRGHRVGSLGGLSVLSFGRGKGWTGGGGGALLARGSAAGRALESWRERIDPPGSGFVPWLKSVAQWLLGRPSLYGIPSRIPSLGLGETLYHDPTPISAPPTVCAALALATADPSAEEVSRREERAALFRAAIAGSERLAGSVRCVEPLEGARPGYLRFPITLPGGGQALASDVAARALGIAGGYPRVLTELPPARPRLVGTTRPDLPGARRLVDRLVTLPTHRYIDGRVVQSVVAQLERAHA